MKDHVWPCGSCPVAKPSKKAIEGHERSHKSLVGAPAKTSRETGGLDAGLGSAAQGAPTSTSVGGVKGASRTPPTELPKRAR